MNTTSPAFSLLALPPLQRKIMVHLTRTGAADRATLGQSLACDPTELQSALAALHTSSQIRFTADGMIEASLGRTRRRTLPARLWPALQTTHRLFSVQEIITLRVAVPIVQFARAKMGEFTDHGPGHILRVKNFATQLGYVLGLTASEHQLLRAAALFHDVGNLLDRPRHHIISQEMVDKLVTNGQLPFSKDEAALIGLLCRWHRKEYDPARTDLLYGETIRTGLVASTLRVADALDSDYRRVDYGPKFKRVLQFFFPEEVPYLDDLATILGIRICCTPALRLQVFVAPQTNGETSYHIGALRKDVADTPLPCTIQVIQCASGGELVGLELAPAQPHKPAALLVAPFEPHSLVMAAISYKQLHTAGYQVAFLIYPDTHGGTAWLWEEGMADFSVGDFAQLVVIGDRPDAASTPALFATVARWQQRGATVTLLNRHQANWAHLPDLLRMGVQTSLAGDWAYFWGEQADMADLFWGRIAALCTRDPIQSTARLTPEEFLLSQGLLQVIYAAIDDAAQQPPVDSAGWSALALPILTRIIRDDRPWFAEQAARFRATYAMLPHAPCVHGNVLVLELGTTSHGSTIFWGLEEAIEAHGRASDHGLRFTAPYALATWVDPNDCTTGETVQLLAISHWREQEATPIRLLYPTELGPTPEGNESAIRVRLPAAQAAQVVQALIRACNEEA